jgi:hypothetical protein
MKNKITFHTKMGMTAMQPINFIGELADAIKAAVNHVNNPPHAHDTYLIGITNRNVFITATSDGRVIGRTNQKNSK